MPPENSRPGVSDALCGRLARPGGFGRGSGAPRRWEGRQWAGGASDDDRETGEARQGRDAQGHGREPGQAPTGVPVRRQANVVEGFREERPELADGVLAEMGLGREVVARWPAPAANEVSAPGSQGIEADPVRGRGHCGARGTKHPGELAHRGAVVGKMFDRVVAHEGAEGRAAEGQPLRVTDDGQHPQRLGLGDPPRQPHHSLADVQHHHGGVRPSGEMQRDGRVGPATRVEDHACVGYVGGDELGGLGVRQHGDVRSVARRVLEVGAEPAVEALERVGVSASQYLGRLLAVTGEGVAGGILSGCAGVHIAHTAVVSEVGPTAPVIHLEAGRRSLRGLVRDVWSARRLIAVLARKDFYVRYRRTSFGALWSVGLPLVQALVLAAVVSLFLDFGDRTRYPVFVFSGMVVWTFFSTTVTGAGTSIVDGADLSTKIYFPRAVFPLVAVGVGTYGFVLSLLVLLGLSLVTGTGIGVRIALLPVAVALAVALTTAWSLVLSALHVYFRDVRYLLQATLLPWFYVTPVFYPFEQVPIWARRWLELNPLTGAVELMRAATVGSSAAWGRPALISAAWAVGMLALGAELHARRDRVFVDLL